MAKRFKATVEFYMADDATDAQAFKELARVLENAMGTSAAILSCGNTRTTQYYACSDGVPGCLGDEPGKKHSHLHAPNKRG